MNEELKRNIKKIKNDLNLAQTQLNNLSNILNQSITFSGEKFQSDNIDKLSAKLKNNMNVLNTKIISKIDF